MHDTLKHLHQHRCGAGTVGPLEDLAAVARYRVESSSAGLPLLRYVLAVRPDHDATP